MDIVHSLTFPFDLGFWMFGLVTLFLPLALVWRSALLSVLCFLSKDLLVGSIASLNIADVVGDAIEVLFLSAVAIGVTIRVAIAAGFKDLTFEALHLGRVTGRYRWIDHLILTITGGIVGFCLIEGMSSRLGGSAGGLMLDIEIALAMAASSAMFAILRPRYVWIAVCSAFGVSAVVALYGAGQTHRIIKGGEVFAAGRPWCLITPSGSDNRRPRLNDIGFFSLRKDNDGAHLLALVRDEDRLVYAEWSIRQQRFHKSKRGGYGSCFPQVDHARALAEDRIEDQVFAVGADIFAVPADLKASAGPEKLRISTVSSQQGAKVLPYGFTDATLSFGDLVPRIPRPSRPLSALDDLDQSDVQSMLRGKSVDFSGTDTSAGRTIVVRCLSGAFSERRCSVTSTGLSETYSFSLPIAEVKNWSKAVDEIAALFERLKVRE